MDVCEYSEIESEPKTSRQLRLQPRLIVNTGDGKGKSTAAFGVGLRGWSQGWSVGVFQFIKTSTWPTGERLAFQTLNGVHQRTGQGGSVEWMNFGEGRTATRAGAKANQRELAEKGWGIVRERLESQTHDLIILDEFCHVLAKGWLDTDEVVRILKNRPGHQHVVITGRNAPAGLIDAADLVTEMRKIKHPFDKGEKGQAGIEW
ncbi:cob(I)yrinic acid a,c-diamide adenosyltransferase [Propionimicrobium sp. PCR01-08-3]|uniref:cob(I)yrinic acid a,c-diamide adenosyltransferase n=1 Tax=Propionimicrobium sp. PCR01-08-3 TaxID=3052086 RepID=UPI00255CBC0B|nr:cob(I)yrinic acid a,c-diamide adenosyltransferase [Propionimicrobium sp. PCR01-08-3]WIY84257.1 cob(I)yrinic acid a,c-diamide adenosyltransferase [Propionimicrobium sp. PCR01-08-3]